MTASLSNLSLTLTQSSQQRVLRVVDVGYSYTLTNPVDASISTGEKDSAITAFIVEIDIIGDDVLSDDLLARAVDQHKIICPEGASVATSRQLTVAQGLLDEDVGDDEIKLVVRVTRDNRSDSDSADSNADTTAASNKRPQQIEATTPIVKGKF